MEAGENPARSRHCIEGVLFSVPLRTGPWGRRGKASKMLISESGDMHRLRQFHFVSEERKRIFLLRCQRKRAAAGWSHDLPDCSFLFDKGSRYTLRDRKIRNCQRK